MHCAVTEKKTLPVSDWKKVGSLSALGKSGVAAPVTGISNNVLIVGGGADFPGALPWLGGKKKYYDEVCMYELNPDTLIQKSKSFKLSSPVAYAANCSTKDVVIYAGGENENGISNKVFQLSWNNSTGELDAARLPDLPVALTNAGMVAYNDQLIICGGETATATSAACFSLNLTDTTGGWKALAQMLRAVSHMVLALQSVDGHDYVYLLGGRCKKETGVSDLYKDVYALDLEENKWEKKTALPYTLTAGTGIKTDDEHIALLGGDTGETFHQSELLTAAIKAEKDTARLAQLNKERVALLNGHPGFSRKVLVYNSRKDSCTQEGSLPFQTPATATAVLWNNKILIAGGEIRAGVRTPDIWSASIINTKQ
ncbi:MAG: hypothetical protein KF862_01710 [Chitinophagaceae bacterium]|nr:hypothetical protein [Chitinophagaceae bacterium]